jgi:hypothetical protein
MIIDLPNCIPHSGKTVIVTEFFGSASNSSQNHEEFKRHSHKETVNTAVQRNGPAPTGKSQSVSCIVYILTRR